jgi:hypothetical protein
MNKKKSKAFAGGSSGSSAQSSWIYYLLGCGVIIFLLWSIRDSYLEQGWSMRRDNEATYFPYSKGYKNRDIKKP